MAKLYGIGVGPGDTELLTLKAVRIIQNSNIIVVPSAKNGGKSIAYDTVKEFIKKDAEVLVMHFPMGGPEQEIKIRENAKEVEKKLSMGQDVVFLTIGDPFIFSTYIYLLQNLKYDGFEVETIPGITSFCACASVANEHLVIGDEPLLVLPATRLDTVKGQKNLAIMKVYKIEEEVLDFLDSNGYEYVYIKKAGREGQEIIRNREDILKSREYMSLIIAHKK
ncbi:cobalt-factor II C(20)-methyltransferase [Haloimpatiens lingqiaonensis]|uniref:cobalt-factor II C(20)-methyltransferase n=1 Tax=Haloimpatiens lingqiaonensis TaxID=1380675 RepID=UPI0010FF14CB|nr:cobalt-factor II C(20)-methyltransferase [Haloimpatiens lingqiaonensis]